MSNYKSNRVPEYAGYGGVPEYEAYGRLNGGVPVHEAYRSFECDVSKEKIDKPNNNSATENKASVNISAGEEKSKNENIKKALNDNFPTQNISRISFDDMTDIERLEYFYKTGIYPY